MDRYDLDGSYGFLLGKAYRRMLQLLSARFKPYNITPEQWTVLCRLQGNDGISQKELAARADKDAPTTTRILDALERKGWVRRETNAEDRRSFGVYSTELGVKLAKQLIPIELQTLRDAAHEIGEDQLIQFKQLLRQISRTAESLQEEEK
ncbi:MarR family transcriptional regulator [Paenibacillus doosanensis]|uniref:Multiple antibiotic resistance protein MarR n=1 Tax=Paenibacillus konkukensis TaxID=2020716 RepID=A0ABY4RJH7_9BACL|nr:MULTISPECIES: MarR family transcriptional regulator [Paenibacillus]MCS7460611.1 MarR family transcriptional regulator [Paenibacillus doosanensis]UQZ82591.1 Multiple antibiotic resistance protein MarR [Paenibacillus konkukensis]